MKTTLYVTWIAVLALFAACISQSGSNTTYYSTTVVPGNAAGGESVTANPATATAGETVILSAALGSKRQVNLSAPGITINPATVTADGGIAAFSMPAFNVAVRATFSDIPPATFSVTVTPDGAAGGEALLASPAMAAAGETVTLTAALGSERQVSLIAPGVTFNPATIAANGGTAIFTMPASNLAITATFSDIPKPVKVFFKGVGNACPALVANQSYPVNIGEEAEDRIIVVCIAGWRDRSRIVNSVTVNGVSLTKHGQDTSPGQPSSIWAGVVPTGTNVAVNIAWNGDNAAAGCAVYSIYNAESAVPVVSLAGGATAYTVTAETGTGIVSFYSAREPYSPSNWSGSLGVVKDVELNYPTCNGVNRLILSTASCVMQSSTGNVSASGSTYDKYLYVLGFK